MQTMFLAVALSVLPMDHDADAAAALALAQAHLSVKKPAEPIPVPQKELSDYLPNPPFVLFVGIEKRAVSGAKVFRNDIQYQLAPGIYFFAADGNTYKATEANIESVVRDRSVQPAASPFDPFSNSNRRLRKGEVRRIADDRLDPQLAEMLRGMEPYTSAMNTQTTFRRQIGFIRPDLRSVLENKWNVPGHLDGIQGWSSRLYKTKGVVPSVFLVAQDPSDSVSAITWGRAYPDVDFADVLRNDKGEVFEVRMASKHNGQWDRFVAFRNADASPTGYIRPTSKECRTCHNQAGISAYGGSAIPGADTIISDPFSNLESGQTIQGGFRTRL